MKHAGYRFSQISAALQWNSRCYGRHGGVSDRERFVPTEWDV
jgi:hypothetical protein